MPNKRTVDALKPRDKRYIAFDDAIKGFGLCVMPSRVKSYILEYRPMPGGRGVSKKRLTIGRHGSATPEQARKAALEASAGVRQAEKSRQRAGLTASDLIDAFLKDHGPRLKPRTRVHYESLMVKVREAHGTLRRPR